MAVAGLVLSIVALVLAWWGYTSLIALPIAIVGLVVGVMGRNKLIAQNQPSGIGTAAMVLGIIAVCITAITFFSCGLCVVCATSAASSINSSLGTLIR